MPPTTHGYVKVLCREVWHPGAVSLEAVAEVLARAVEDEEFRTRLVENPADALADYDLSPTEMAAFRGGELRRLLARGDPMGCSGIDGASPEGRGSIVRKLAGWTALVLLLVASAPMSPAAAASKYKACSVLTNAELEAALGAKVSRSAERDTVIPQGPYQGETMSSCDWALETTYVAVSIIRQLPSGKQRAAGLAMLQQATENLRSKGWTIESARIGDTACVTARPPASERSALPSLSCYQESKGFVLSIDVVTRAPVTVQQVKALADKATARLP